MKTIKEERSVRDNRINPRQKILSQSGFYFKVIYFFSYLKNQIKSFKVSLRNFLYMVTVQIGNYLLPLFVIPIVAKRVGVEKWGELEYATSLVVFFAIFINFGFQHFGTQEIVENKKNKKALENKFKRILNAKAVLFLGASAIAFFLLALNLIKIDLKLFLFTYLICIGHLVNPIWFFLGIEKSGVLSLTHFFSKLILLILVVLVITRPEDYYYFNLIISCSYVIASAASFFYAVKKYKLHLAFIPVKKTLQYIRLATPAAINEIAVGVNSAGTILLLGLMLNSKQVGVYTAANKIIFVIQGLALIPFSQAFFPRFSTTAKNNSISFWKEFCTVGLILFISFGTLGILIFNNADLLIFYIFGKEFNEAIAILRLLAFLPLAIAVNNMISYQGLLAFKEYKALTTITIITGFLSIILNILLIPHFQLISVVFIRISIQILTAGVSFFILLKTVKKALAK